MNPHTRIRAATPNALAAHAPITVAQSATPDNQRLDLMVGTYTKGRREFPVDPESYVPRPRYVRVLLITARSRTRLKGNTIVSIANGPFSKRQFLTDDVMHVSTSW